ncbi:MAG: replicative DNA helicase, partial [Lentisphaerae bacterium]|nr:replicative DNA helicase [Lentisphaerota bacterium]
DATPTAAHAEYYIGIVRQKYLFRRVIDTARLAEVQCYDTDEDADVVLGRVEQAFLDITEHQHGYATPWNTAVKETMEKIEQMLVSRRGLRGISTGFRNLDEKVLGLKPGEMTILAARPSMGKTSLAMNIAENIVLGRGDPEHNPRPVGMFSLEMAYETLVMRMLCSHAGISAFKLSQGFVSKKGEHGRLIQAADVLTRAPLYVDDAAGLDVLDLRARARRMKKKFNIEVIVVDYLQLLNAKEYSRQGRQIETAAISGQLKAAAKELNIPVLVLSQLSRAPEQRSDKRAKPKLSDLRDSGAIEQDADVVWMLRRPSRNDADEEFEDKTLAYVDVAKNRNGPTGEVQLNFEEEYTRFTDRTHGVDSVGTLEPGEDEENAEEDFVE